MWILLFIAAGWESRGSLDSILIESRPVPGSSYESVRLTTHTQVPAKVQADAIWFDSPSAKEIIEHRVLEEAPTTRLYYEVISAPMISEREALVKAERTQNGETERIAFRSVEDPLIPAQPGRIRMKIVGSFEVVPDGAGGSLVTYEIFTDLRGSLAGWMVNEAKRHALVASLKTQLEHGAKRLALSQR